ncbi:MULTISPECIES: BTAD domain-containing putative transcriptional regulator [Meiothermus]
MRQALYLLRRLPGAGTWLLDGERPALYAEVDALAPTLEALRAPLLPGLPDDLPPAFWDWLALERQRLEGLRRERLWQAAQTELEQALGYLYELIQLDPLHESAVREAMRLEAQAGRVQTAWQLYESLRQTLQQELGVEPLAATQAQAALLQPIALSPLAQRLWEARSLYAEEVRPEFWARVLEEEPYAVARAWAELEATPPPPLLPQPLRRHLCRRIALALEAQGGEPSTTARYWLGALEPERAYPQLQTAGRLALQQGKPNEARLAFFRALWTADTAPLQLEALLGLAQVAELQGDLDLMEALVQRLGELARRHQCDRAYFEHHQRKAGLRLRQGKPQEAALEAQEALEVARRLADEERIALARLSLGAAHLVAGALEEARPHLEAATSPKPPDPAAGPEQPGGAVRFTR